MGGPSTDQQTLLVRRAVAIGGLVLLLILLFVAVRSCASSRKENALKDYNREVSSIVRESDTQVGQPFFQLLGQAGSESPQDLQTNISGYRVQAEALLKQARNLSVPGEMKGAQQSLLMALEFRRDGLGFIAEKIRTALGDEGEAANDAITQIAGQMQAFLASDVLYQARTAPLIKAALDDAEIGGQRIASSRFLPGIEWLSEKTVAAQLEQELTGGTGGERGTPAPGLHGTGIDSVSVGDTTLEPDAPNRIPASADTAFVVRFTNQGENDEFDVKVNLTVEGGDKPIKVSRTVDTVARGATAEASLALGTKPPTGSAVTVKVTVAKVPGEEKTDNNTSEYDVLFTEG
ncbi:MAG TPA: hypothetical protein VEX67_12945 [Solirubrobacteraceae bacterium]|nr:hypothetical protein [Solirubrobacteraceae bacterium]